MRLSASIVGSSRNSADSSGLAPTRSPAATISVFGLRRDSLRTCVARNSAPPAGTRSRRRSVRRPIRPEVADSRCPWKSLMPSSWTFTGSGGRLRFLAAAAGLADTSATSAPMTRIRNSTGSRTADDGDRCGG